MRARALWLVFWLTACADPYEVARTEKLAHSPGCNIPFGTPADAHVAPTESVSALTTCEITQVGPSGFVTLKGLGSRSAYGDVSDAFMSNAMVEPGVGCAGAAGDFSASRAFWAQVQAGLRERLIVTIGNGAHQDCAGQSSQPEFLSIYVVDWADLRNLST